jgi:hypothetical protein
MRSFLMKCAAGIVFASIGVRAFDPFERESLELESLRNRSADASDPTSDIKIDPEKSASHRACRSL